LLAYTTYFSEKKTKKPKTKRQSFTINLKERECGGGEVEKEEK